MSQETYREQIRRLTKALVAGQYSELGNDLDSLSEIQLVREFGNGNLDKRCDKLLGQLALLHEVFPDLERLVMAYIRGEQSAAYDSVISDGERMLNWLEVNHNLSLEQRDYLTCQRARHEVEELARDNRLLHVLFQERSSVSDRWLRRSQLPTELGLTVNPITVWANFLTNALLDDETDLPAQTAFFPVGDEISTAVVELEGVQLIQQLENVNGPLTIHEVLAQNPGDEEEQLQSIRDFVEVGLLAFV